MQTKAWKHGGNFNETVFLGVTKDKLCQAAGRDQEMKFYCQGRSFVSL